jgi:hypothetical protein
MPVDSLKAKLEACFGTFRFTVMPIGSSLSNPAAENLENQQAPGQERMNIRVMNAEDPARKKTQEFDPALVDERGIHPESTQDAEPAVLEQEQGDQDVKERLGRSASWHQFKTP